MLFTVTTRADGAVGTQTSRVLGINGPRWLLRATVFGRPAVDPEAGLMVSMRNTHLLGYDGVAADAIIEAGDGGSGAGKAKQSIVNALVQGPESAYAIGEAISRAYFSPILRSHRVTLEQMAILEPEVAILDETDSGLDIDALQVVAKGVNEVRASRPELGVVLITHYQRLLEHLRPDHVHVLVDGRIVASGGMELAEQLEAHGYEAFRGVDA